MHQFCLQARLTNQCLLNAPPCHGPCHAPLTRLSAASLLKVAGSWWAGWTGLFPVGRYLTVLANTAAMDDRDSISCSYTNSSSASHTRSISVTSSTVTVPSVPDRIIEPLDYYSKQKFHPVHLMDTFQDARYMVVRKLGYGSFSTVWLARDSKYVRESRTTTRD